MIWKSSQDEESYGLVITSHDTTNDPNDVDYRNIALLGWTLRTEQIIWMTETILLQTASLGWSGPLLGKEKQSDNINWIQTCLCIFSQEN